MAVRGQLLMKDWVIPHNRVIFHVTDYVCEALGFQGFQHASRTYH